MVAGESKAIETVRQTLEEYAHKGVFRKLTFAEHGSGISASFDWLSKLRPFHFTVDLDQNTLSFEDFFPTFPPEVERDSLQLLNRFADNETPAHRRIDPEKAELMIAIEEDGAASLVLELRGDDFEYGVRRLINVVNEFYHSLQVTNAEYSFHAFGGFEE